MTPQVAIFIIATIILIAAAIGFAWFNILK